MNIQDETIAVRMRDFLTFVTTGKRPVVDKGKRPKRPDRRPRDIVPLVARMGGYATAAKHDPLEYTAKARQVFKDRFADMVDPERKLPPEERARRAEAARRAFYTNLSLKGVAARAKKREGSIARN